MEPHHIWGRSINIIYSTEKQQRNVYMLEERKKKEPRRRD